jgi:hypothetical protein
MSELSLAELLAENIELLPERETLSTIVINANNAAIASGFRDTAVAINNNRIILIDSGNGNTIIGSFNGDHVFFPSAT